MYLEDYIVDLAQSGSDKKLIHMLNMSGCAIFGGVNTPEQLINLAQEFGTVVRHPDSNEQGVTRIAPTEESDHQSGYKGFTSHELILHTDRTSVPEPPAFLLMYCSKPAPEGGLSKLLDGRRLYEKLDAQYIDLLHKILVSKSAIFGDPNNHPFVGSIFSKDENGLITVRFRFDELGYYSAPVASELNRLLQIMDGLQFSFKLDSGQGYIVNNRRCLHGRTSFSGEREMYRVLVNTDYTSRLGPQIVTGFEI